MPGRPRHCNEGVGAFAEPRDENAVRERFEPCASPPETRGDEHDRGKREPRRPGTEAAGDGSDRDRRGAREQLPSWIQFEAARPRHPAATSKVGQPYASSRLITGSRGRGAARSWLDRFPTPRRARLPTRNGPWAVRQSTIFCAVTGPIPGSESSCSIVAEERLTLTPAEPAPVTPTLADAAPGGVATRAGTTICMPSTSGAARLINATSARRVGPPAAPHGVCNPSSVAQPIETGTTDGADHVDHQP